MAYLDNSGQTDPSFLQALARALGIGGSTPPPPPNRAALASALSGRPIAPPSTHYSQLPGPPLLLADNGDAATAGLPKSLPPAVPPVSTVASPFAATRGEMSDIPNAGMAQAAVQPQTAAAQPIDSTSKDSEPATVQVAQATSAPSAYEQTLKARFDQQRQLINSTSNPEVAKMAISEANKINDELSAFRKPGSRILTDAELTPAERATGAEWQLSPTGDRSQVPGTANDKTRAPNDEEAAQIVEAGGNPKEWQVKGGEFVHSLGGKSGESSEIQNYKFDQKNRVEKGLPPISFSDWNTQKQSASKGGVMTMEGKAPDESLSGFDYLSQFPKNIQASVKSILDGESMPSGRLSADRQAVKDIASRVGQDIGEPMDDASFAGRRKLITDLSSSSPSSLGGQNKAADTAIQHANAVSDILLRLHSAPGGGNSYVAGAINRIAGLGGDPNRASDLTALDSQLTGLGQEMTKMFAGSPGAEAERLDPVRQFPRYGTPQEQAAYIDTQINRIMARVNDNERQTHVVLGDRLAAKYPALSPHVQKIVSQDLPSKSAELYKRSASGALFGGPSERPPPIDQLPSTLREASPSLGAAPVPLPAAGKVFNYVPGKGLVPQ